MSKIGYVVTTVILGAIVLIALLMGQRSCLGAIQALPAPVVSTTVPPGPTPTPEVEAAVAATLRPEVIDQSVAATRQSWVTPSPTPCGWQGLCPLATPTATQQATATPWVVTATPVPPTAMPLPSPTAAASPISVNACSGTLTVFSPGGTSAIMFTEGISLAYDAGGWAASTRLTFSVDRDVEWMLSRPALAGPGLDYVYPPASRGYEFRFAYPHPAGGETFVGQVAHVLAGPQYHLRATYTEGQATCQASVFFQVDP